MKSRTKLEDVNDRLIQLYWNKHKKYSKANRSKLILDQCNHVNIVNLIEVQTSTEVQQAIQNRESPIAHQAHQTNHRDSLKMIASLYIRKILYSWQE